jgi:hypothetical protein
MHEQLAARLWFHALSERRRRKHRISDFDALPDAKRGPWLRAAEYANLLASLVGDISNMQFTSNFCRCALCTGKEVAP